MDLKYFGTDGVRGVANQDLSPELAFQVGRAGGYVLTRHSERKQPQVLVARDTRISGQMLENALVAGLLSVGSLSSTGPRSGRWCNDHRLA